jgi:anti-sigma B factor antagonist
MEWSIVADRPDPGDGSDHGDRNHRYAKILVAGEFDLYTASKFTEDVIDHIQAGGTRIVMDLSGVTYLDSTGVGSLIHLMQIVKKAEGEILFSGIKGIPRKVLMMSNILTLMKETGTEGIE